MSITKLKKQIRKSPYRKPTPTGVPLLNQDRIRQKKRFIYKIRKIYVIGGLSPQILWKCFLSYLGFIEKLGCDFIKDKTEWQLEDFKKAIFNHKCMWHRTRRGGKTLGLTLIAVFYSLINFGWRANKGKVIWRAPHTDQLQQAQEWLARNPFVQYINNQNDVYVFVGRLIDMACLSDGKAASKGASVMIEDEYRDVYKGLKMYDIAGRAEAIVSEGLRDHTRLLSASTGCRLTYFHNQYLGGEWVYCRHSYKECPWITEEYVESIRKEHPDDPYFVQQEFEAVWVARGDTAYRNIYIVDTKAKTVTNNENTWKFGDHPFFPLNWQFPYENKGGLDWNDNAGHYLVLGSEDDEAIYCNREIVFRTVSELKAYSFQFDIEVESGPFEINIVNSRKASQIGCRVRYQYWLEQVIATRFKKSMSKMIIIDRWRCMTTLLNLNEAVFDENARESKLKKRPDQHGLDALLHMIHKRFKRMKPLKHSEQERNYLKRRKQNASRITEQHFQ